jgi:hypothetical protein
MCLNAGRFPPATENTTMTTGNNDQTPQAPKTTKAAYGLRYEPAKFVDRGLAFKNAASCIKPHRVMLGDDMRYWVVCPADAQRLERQGIEYAD